MCFPLLFWGQTTMKSRLGFWSWELLMMALTVTVPIHRVKLTGEREAEAESGREQEWGGYVIVSV